MVRRIRTIEQKKKKESEISAPRLFFFFFYFTEAQNGDVPVDIIITGPPG